MTTLDDKILGEKLQYYYSSSEDEGSEGEDEEGQTKTIRNPDVLEPEVHYSADGSAVNTGLLTRWLSRWRLWVATGAQRDPLYLSLLRLYVLSINGE